MQIQKQDAKKCEDRNHDLVEKQHELVDSIEHTNSLKMAEIKKELEIASNDLSMFRKQNEDLKKNNTLLERKTVVQDLGELAMTKTEINNEKYLKHLVQKAHKSHHHKKEKSSDQWTQQAQALNMIKKEDV